jgi:hypothetical protein
MIEIMTTYRKLDMPAILQLHCISEELCTRNPAVLGAANQL